tara:strand:+ start:2840 stop:3205 length:366 start_codon:yes stop_codon:yes gene_type:complete
MLKSSGIWCKATGRRISIASVYRSLAQLVRIGLVEIRHFDASMGRYELTAKPSHGHLLDVSTGDVVEFNDAELNAMEDKIAARLGYRILRRSVELRAVKLAERPAVTSACASADSPSSKTL